MAVAEVRKKRLTPERAELAAQSTEIARRAAIKFIRSHNIPMHRWPLIEWDDAFSTAYEAICRAAYDWNVASGPFQPYAYVRAWFAMVDWLRVDGPITRAGAKRLRTISWVDETFGPSPWGDHAAPTEYLLRDEQREQDHADVLAGRQFVRHCLRCMTEKQAYVMHETLVTGKSNQDIAAELGVSEGRVTQIRNEAVKRLWLDDEVLYACAA